MNEDIGNYNRGAWDHQVETGDKWTVPVSPEQVAAARKGDWSIVLTPTKPIPTDWFPTPSAGAQVLLENIGEEERERKIPRTRRR